MLVQGVAAGELNMSKVFLCKTVKILSCFGSCPYAVSHDQLACSTLAVHGELAGLKPQGCFLPVLRITLQEEFDEKLNAVLFVLPGLAEKMGKVHPSKSGFFVHTFPNFLCSAQ